MTEASSLPPHGNYAELLSYQKAQIVYDLTYRFCSGWVKGDRTIDQMVQAVPESRTSWKAARLR